MQPAKILFIDAYDSFSNSIITLLQEELNVQVSSIKIDDARFVLNDEAFFDFVRGFNAVVAGPGPGNPSNPSDVGLIGKLWHQPIHPMIPVLGVCLGFQSLCIAFGASIERLPQPRHGVTASIHHSGEDIFTSTGNVIATQYHSLRIRLGDRRRSQAEECDLWRRGQTCSPLKPLAWDVSCKINGATLMAVRHVSLPFWGVQYHPESICTNEEGHKVIRNWWDEVSRWNGKRCSHGLREPNRIMPCPVKASRQNFKEHRSPLHCQPSIQRHVRWMQRDLGKNFNLVNLIDRLRNATQAEPFLLESGTRDGKPVRPETGRYTVIGLVHHESMHIRYHTASKTLRMVKGGNTISSEPSSVHGAFTRIEDVMHSQKAASGPSGSPFWGGLMGFISYEAGLESIDVTPCTSSPDRPDIWFVFVERSIVIDHVENTFYVQTIRADDADWLDSTVDTVNQTSTFPDLQEPCLIPGELVYEPQMAEYCAKIEQCQANLHAGESYELCLTDQTTIHSDIDTWSFYRHLRTRNPAPFSSCFILHDQHTPSVSVVSSSPERFLSWSRDGQCQFRPIKGTVKKEPGVTRAHAEAILKSEKERAENLMIVDLIRHDLSGVAGVTDVHVPKLMSIEEYETVYQLVSVIEGTLPSHDRDSHSSRQPARPAPHPPTCTSPSPPLDPSHRMTTGIGALAASLPPGSMTGAPKKRSCELLRAIEGLARPRGLYSGVIGYCDVGGGGDFAVVIRTAFKWDDHGDGAEGGVGAWQVGAGGAVTVLSETRAEWEEMRVKREAVLASFSLG